MVCVSVKMENGFLVVDVWDNGCGISEEKILSIQSDNEVDSELCKNNNGIALKIIRRRLQLSYSEFEFEITSKENEFTNVKIVIPTTKN